MTERHKISVEAERVYRVLVHKVETVEPASPTFVGVLCNIVGRRKPLWQETTWRFEHLGAALLWAARSGTADPQNDLWNVWKAISFEAGPFPTTIEIIAYNADFRARAEPLDVPQTYLYSNRELPGQGLILGAVDITSGYNNVLTLSRERAVGESQISPRPVGTYALQHNAPWAARMRSPDEQLADWDDIRPMFEDQNDPSALARWQAAREKIQLLKLEKFEPYSARLSQADMTIRGTQLAPGIYCPSFVGNDQFYNWDTENTVDYATYRIPTVGTPSVDLTGPAVVQTGHRSATSVMAHLVPRRHEILFSWTAVYLAGTLFTAPVFITENNVGAYSNILPLDWSYVGAEDEFRNDVSMSNWIAQSRRYAVAAAQDLGSQVFSLYFFKILVARMDAQWCVREGRRTAGDLCAVLDCDHGRYDPSDPDARLGGRVRYEISRKTTVEGGRRINFGALDTPDTIGYSEDGQSIWPGSIPFGGL